MAINRETIIRRVVNKADQLGIDLQVGNEDSHTIQLLTELINAIVDEIIDGSEVEVRSITTKGTGYAGTPVISQVLKFGEGKIIK